MTSWRKWRHKLHLVSRWFDRSSVDRHIANGNFNCWILYSYWNVPVWSRRFWRNEKPIYDCSRQLHCLRCFRIWKSNMWVAPRGFLSYFPVSWWRRISLAWNDFWPYNFSYKCLVHGSGILIVVNCYLLCNKLKFSVGKISCNFQLCVQRSLSAKNISHAKAGVLLAAYLKVLPFFFFIMCWLSFNSGVTFLFPAQIFLVFAAYHFLV